MYTRDEIKNANNQEILGMFECAVAKEALDYQTKGKVNQLVLNSKNRIILEIYNRLEKTNK